MCKALGMSPGLTPTPHNVLGHAWGLNPRAPGFMLGGAGIGMNPQALRFMVFLDTCFHMGLGWGPLCGARRE